MEIIFNFFEVYLNLMIPESKSESKAHRAVAITVALISMLGNLALFVWGIVLFERRNWRGIFPILIALLWMMVQILFGFIMDERNEHDLARSLKVRWINEKVFDACPILRFIWVYKRGVFVGDDGGEGLRVYRARHTLRTVCNGTFYMPRARASYRS